MAKLLNDNKTIKTKSYGEIEYSDTILYYDYPRACLFKDKDNRDYFLIEYKVNDIFTEWWVSDLSKQNITIEEIKSNNPYKIINGLEYSLSLTYFLDTKCLLEKKIQDKKIK